MRCCAAAGENGALLHSPPPHVPLLPTRTAQEHLHDFMAALLRKAQRHADAGPFLRPVPAEDVPDYYTIIVVRG